MRFLRSIAGIIVLLTLSLQADANQRQITCQKMVLSLLDHFDINDPWSQQQVLYFADMCMPDSALSENPQTVKKLQLLKDDGNVVTVQARI